MAMFKAACVMNYISENLNCQTAFGTSFPSQFSTTFEGVIDLMMAK
jgi:hypothetical protein